MDLQLPFVYPEPQAASIMWVRTLIEIVKVQRSNDGFQTSTRTTRPCRDCRAESQERMGIEPWPVAVWLVTMATADRAHWLQVPLCSNHFKLMREQAQGYVPVRYEGENTAQELTVYRA